MLASARRRCCSAARSIASSRSSCPPPSRFAAIATAGIGAEDVTLVDARFCGARDAGHGRFIGVLRPAGGGSAALPALDVADCRGKLDEVAKRLAAAPDAGAVAAVESDRAVGPVGAARLDWRRRRGRRGGRSLARTLARAKAAGPLATVETGGLRLETERGSALSLDLALSFLKGSDGALATLTVACPGCVPAPRAPFVTAAGAPPDSDGVVGATLRFANRVVALFSEDGPLVLGAGSPDRRDPQHPNLGRGGDAGGARAGTSRAVSETARAQHRIGRVGPAVGGGSRRRRAGGLQRAVRRRVAALQRAQRGPRPRRPPPSPAR